MSEEILTKKSFEPYLNDTFQIKFEGGELLELELAEINEDSNEQSERFSLVFKGPPEKTVVQMTYRITHEKMGELLLFLVPIAPGQYETVFNRIKE